jgi:VIT1/CCC1 family predicted Fe2+/Mn2+ transporter
MKQEERDKKITRAQSGTARASLLGLSDGLVTNVALILGVAGTGVDASVVRIAGIASLIAGACSMAVGEYISMRGQVELLSSVLELEREEFSDDPEKAKNSIAELMRADGMSQDTAAKAAAEVMKDRKLALMVYIRQRFGLNQDELGAAWGSAISSFVTFSAGAVVPLLPWFWLHGATAIAPSLGLASAAALAIGGYLGYSTNGKWAKSALRQLFVLVLAAGVTYLIGLLFHTRVS